MAAAGAVPIQVAEGVVREIISVGPDPAARRTLKITGVSNGRAPFRLPDMEAVMEPKSEAVQVRALPVLAASCPAGKAARYKTSPAPVFMEAVAAKIKLLVPGMRPRVAYAKRKQNADPITAAGPDTVPPFIKADAFAVPYRLFTKLSVA